MEKSFKLVRMKNSFTQTAIFCYQATFFQQKRPKKKRIQLINKVKKKLKKKRWTTKKKTQNRQKQVLFGHFGSMQRLVGFLWFFFTSYLLLLLCLSWASNLPCLWPIGRPNQTRLKVLKYLMSKQLNSNGRTFFSTLF